MIDQRADRWTRNIKRFRKLGLGRAFQFDHIYKHMPL